MFKSILRFIEQVKFSFRIEEKFLFRIMQIDVSAQEVTFSIKNKATILKYHFAEAVNDKALIQGLSPGDACWLGGYFGRAMRASLEGREALKQAKNMTYLLANKQGRYKIVFQNRNGDIGYFDKKTRQEFVEHPLTVANNEYVISGFDPSQACYIGILAGISMEKIASQDKKTGGNQLEGLLKRSPKLRIVK